MDDNLSTYLLQSAGNIRRTASEDLDGRMDLAINLISAALRARNPVLVCGNGGSQSDAQHIAGELVSRFLLDRTALPVIALGANSSTLTAWSNDVAYDTALAREVEAYGREGGVCLGISTSGNSRNIYNALVKAREIGMSTVALTGNGGGVLKSVSNVLLDVPETSTPRIQELHICLYHYLCIRVEAACKAHELASSPSERSRKSNNEDRT